MIRFAATMPEHDLNARDRSTETLQSLSAAAAAGDERAFEQIHKRLDTGLRRLLRDRARGREDLAADFAQRTWTQVWQALRAGKYDPSRAAISTFVYAVGHRVWLQHLRSQGRADARQQALQIETAGRQGAAEPADDARTAEVVDAVRACLRGDPGTAGLSEEERWILRASSSGITDRELAQRLRIAPSTANERKKAAYDKLRRFLESRGHRHDSTERGGSGGG